MLNTCYKTEHVKGKCTAKAVIKTRAGATVSLSKALIMNSKWDINSCLFCHSSKMITKAVIHLQPEAVSSKISYWALPQNVNIRQICNIPQSLSRHSLLSLVLAHAIRAVPSLASFQHKFKHTLFQSSFWWLIQVLRPMCLYSAPVTVYKYDIVTLNNTL